MVWTTRKGRRRLVEMQQSTDTSADTDPPFIWTSRSCKSTTGNSKLIDIRYRVYKYQIKWEILMLRRLEVRHRAKTHANVFLCLCSLRCFCSFKTIWDGKMQSNLADRVVLSLLIVASPPEVCGEQSAARGSSRYRLCSPSAKRNDTQQRAATGQGANTFTCLPALWLTHNTCGWPQIEL